MVFLDKIKELFNYHKVNLIGGAILLIIIFVSNFGIYVIVNDKVSNIKVDTKEIALEEEVIKEETEEKEYYKFDIKGSINKPGVYSLEKGSRVIDAINIAGGLTDNADTSVNNLSKYISDEMVIVIYTKDEVLSFSKIEEKETLENKACVEYNDVITNDSCKEEVKDIIASEVDTKISINLASIDLLMTLPGIGESKAKSIISYREENGSFTSIEDIMNVSGIGESLFEKIKNYITI